MDMTYKKYQMQEYLVSSLLETREKKFLFQVRLRMLNVKTNFRNSLTDLSCPLCKHEEDTQKHLLRCPFLSTNQPVLSNPEYTHIFNSDVNKQINITRIFMGLWKMRKKMVKKWWIYGKLKMSPEMWPMWSDSNFVMVCYRLDSVWIGINYYYYYTVFIFC